MIIDRIDVYYVKLPLKSPWRTAYGEDPDVHSVLVRMTSGDRSGWGETSPLYAPTYSPESAMSVFYTITEFIAPQLVGRDVESPSDLYEAVKWIKGNPFAKAGPDMAWWSLKSDIEGRPLHEILGGKLRKVDAGADFGIQDSYDILLEKIQGAVDRGFKRVKLKACPGWDLEMMQTVRSTFPKQRFHIDCNAAYTLDDLDLFRKIDKLGLDMIEQPLFHTDLLEHAELQKKIDTPVCLDESIKSVRDLVWAIKMNSCRVLNIKPGRVGGLTAALELRRRAAEAGMECWVGSMLESGIGAGILIELACLDGFGYPGDLFPSSRFYVRDLTEPEIVLGDDCTLKPSVVPGTPYKPVVERIDAATHMTKSITR